MSETHWTLTAQNLLQSGDSCVLASIVAVAGSAPREAGVRMMITPDRVVGTVGGGALEFTIIEQARRLLTQSEKRALTQDYPLGPLLAQCCGGHVRVLLERLDARDLSWIAQVAEAERSGEVYALRVCFAEDGASHEVTPGWPKEIATPAVVLFDRDGISAFEVAVGSVGRRCGWNEMVEYARPTRTSIYLFGAGHVGQALAPILRILPVALYWLDSRAECEGAVFASDPSLVIDNAPPGSVFVIMTHSHDLDLKLTQTALARRDALYCGLIGSRTKRARFLKRMSNAGLDARALEGLTCPIGAIGLKGKSPAVIALATAAEIMLRIEAKENAGVIREDVSA